MAKKRTMIGNFATAPLEMDGKLPISMEDVITKDQL